MIKVVLDNKGVKCNMKHSSSAEVGMIIYTLVDFLKEKQEFTEKDIKQLVKMCESRMEGSKFYDKSKGN